MGLFATISDVKSKSTSRKFTPGDYKVEVQILKTHASQKERGIHFLIMEGTVVESVGPEAQPVGSTVGHAIKLSSEPAWQDAKALLAAVLGIDPDEISEELCDEAVAQDGAAVAGEQVNAYATEHIKDGKRYVNIAYSMIG